MAEHGIDYVFSLMNYGELWQTLEIGLLIWKYGGQGSTNG